MSRWFVVHTHANAEAKARDHLERQGFATYLPHYQKARRHARRVENVKAPLFPRYLFVAFDPLAASWRTIYSTVGVARLVGYGDAPTPVPNEVVSLLRARENVDGSLSVPEQGRLAVGDRVKVLAGPFAEMLGSIHELSDRERVVVLLDFLGRRVKTQFSSAAVAVET